MIQVTRPFLPPRAEYEAYIRQIWDNNWLTNNGPLLVELEQQLKAYLGVERLMMMTNGTVTLQALLKTIKRKGKILTTPFSYIATCSAILWEDFTPVFVDIDPLTFNADPTQATKYIDSDTVGVLITHCFGVPCDVAGWDAISKAHDIPVIYDAAHAFGVKIGDESILNFGYASSLSFHATKLFHTVEGGAVVVSSDELEREIQLRRNFGHDGPDRFSEVGSNGKNSEFHSAMGLVNLQHIQEILVSRKEQYQYYLDNLRVEETGLVFQHIPENVTYNYSYFPVVFPSEEILLKVFSDLQQKDIFPRRYFYPALNSLSFTKGYMGDTPVAEHISKRILCLPIFHTMTRPEQDYVIASLRNALRHA
jgi:dTDP-4-amino-4,6-dideoxygalactose transaminase